MNGFEDAASALPQPETPEATVPHKTRRILTLQAGLYRATHGIKT